MRKRKKMEPQIAPNGKKNSLRFAGPESHEYAASDEPD
jgi:hypothetical protein